MSITVQGLKQRARFLALVRDFFQDRLVMEVETPLMSRAASTDPGLESFVCHGHNQTDDFYLQTSPEFCMKRLLANGSGDIYQIAKAFRVGEYGRWHNPEFTLLEWYRVGWDTGALISECIELIRYIAQSQTTMSVQQCSYHDLFMQSTGGINPHTAPQSVLLTLIREHELELGFNLNTLSREACLDLIMTHIIEPGFDCNSLTVIYDYPASQAALARLESVTHGQQRYQVAKRFEIYWGQVELANGFQELTDAQEQLQRFEQDNLTRRQNNLPTRPVDQHFLQALSNVPDCSGVALGLDRLIACANGYDGIKDIISFDFEQI